MYDRPHYAAVAYTSDLDQTADMTGSCRHSAGRGILHFEDCRIAERCSRGFPAARCHRMHLQHRHSWVGFEIDSSAGIAVAAAGVAAVDSIRLRLADFVVLDVVLIVNEGDIVVSIPSPNHLCTFHIK